MNQFYPRTRIAVFALAGLLCSMSLAHADMGPNFGPRGDVFISVRFPGDRPAGKCRTVLLSPGSTDGLRAPKDEKDAIPMLKERLEQNDDGNHWTYCDSYPNPENAEAVRLFFRRVSGGGRGGFPRFLRLAMYFPAEDKLFLTDPIETSRRDHNRFRATLYSDGTGTLENAEPDSWMEKYYVWEMLVALAGTLVIELSIVALWMAFTKRRATLSRVLLVALAGNLLTVPFVWGASLVGKVSFDVDTAWLIYALAEIAAFAVEGSLYAWLGQLRITNAMLLSFTANCASFLCGCCLVSFY